MKRIHCNIFFLFLSLAIALGLSLFATPTLAASCPCVPNRAVWPDGNDPTCVNGVYVGNDPSYCSVTGGNTGSNSSLNGINSDSLSSVSCSPSSVKDFKSLVMNLLVGCFYSLTIRLIAALSVVLFLWGVFKFVRSEGDEERNAGKQFILWGLVGLFIIVSLWGLVSILSNTITLNNGPIIAPPSGQ